jgi:hypothetical protein
MSSDIKLLGNCVMLKPITVGDPSNEKVHNYKNVSNSYCIYYLSYERPEINCYQ